MMEIYVVTAALVVLLTVCGVLLTILFRRYRQEIHLNSLVSSISQEIVILEESASIAAKIKQMLIKHMDVMNVSIVLYDETQQEFSYITAGEKESTLPQEIINRISFYFETKDTPVSHKQVEKDVELEKETRDAVLQYFQQTRAQVCVPLIFERRLIGIVNLEKKKAQKGFSRSDMRLLTNIMRHMSVAFTNSLLFRRMSNMFEEGEGQNQELKKKEERQGMLFSNLGHELKIPVAAIENYIQYLMSGKYGEINEKQHEILEMTDGEMRRIERLINSMQTYSALQSRKLQPQSEAVYLPSLIDECVREESALAEQKGLSMHTEVQEDIYVKADRDMLKEVLLNLILNAVRYTEEGHVTVSASLNQEVTVSVSDTGIGIAKEHQSEIFERGADEKSFGKRFSGPGIGLPIVQELLSLHNSRIEVQSTVGEGSTFSFKLAPAQ